MQPSENEKLNQEESKIVREGLVGLFDLLAKYDFEDSKKLTVGTTTTVQTGVLIPDVNQEVRTNNM